MVGGGWLGWGGGGGVGRRGGGGKKKDDDEKRTSSTTSEITTTYFHGKCQFPSGTTERALNARDIAVQVALAGGTTNPKHLSAKAISKFQSLDK